MVSVRISGSRLLPDARHALATGKARCQSRRIDARGLDDARVDAVALDEEVGKLLAGAVQLRPNPGSARLQIRERDPRQQPARRLHEILERDPARLVIVSGLLVTDCR